MEYDIYLGSMITNDVRCTREIKSRIAIAKSSTQQEENSFHQQTGLIFKEETSKVVHLEYSFVWCWNVDTSESRSEIPGRFWNVVLEKDGENQLDRSCEKWRSITQSQVNILRTIKRRKANWIGYILRRKCLLRQFIEGKIEGRIEMMGRHWRRCKELPDDLKERRG